MPDSIDRGFTMIELLIVAGLLAIIVALTVPGLMRARIAANEASAIASMRVTAAAQKAFLATCGNGGYATDYRVLGRTGPNGEASFISDDLGTSATPTKSGYTYALAAGAGSSAGPDDCQGAPTATHYYATGVPTAFGSSGTRSFAVNSLSMIWQVTDAAAPGEPFGPPSTAVR
jgi:prepilin-type N-terminal cleavage/methylation domain-containing protein